MARPHDAGLFLALAGLWGGSFVAIEVGLGHYPPVLFAAFRFDLAAALLVSYVLLAEERPLPETRVDLLAVLFGGGFSVAANNSLLFVGQQFTTSGVAAVVYSLVPIVTVAVAAVAVGDAGIDAVTGFGVLLGVAGVGLVARPAPGALVEGVTFGVALIFLGVIFVAAGSVGLRHLRTSFSSIVLTAWAMLFGGLCMHAFSLGLGEPQTLPVAVPEAVVALVFLGVFASALAYTIYFTLLERLGAFESNLVSYVVPVVATATGWALLGEEVTAVTVLGFCVIVAGFLLVKRRAVADRLVVWAPPFRP